VQGPGAITVKDLRRRGFTSATRLVAGVAALWLLLCTQSVAQTSIQWWPGFDAFIRFNERTRLYLNYSSVRDLDTNSGQLQNVGLGSFLDITLKPIFSRKLARKPDWKRRRYLWARVGYQFETTIHNSTFNHVGVVELNARLPLPKAFLVEPRIRTELRDLNGAYSTRYRYRLQIERNTQVFGVRTIPFVNAEVFYDTRFDTASRERYEAGMQVVLNRQWRLKPYYAREHNVDSSPTEINAIGFTLRYYR
jgi:hypothetical protein